MALTNTNKMSKYFPSDLNEFSFAKFTTRDPSPGFVYLIAALEQDGKDLILYRKEHLRLPCT